MPSSLRSEERRGSEEHTSELQSHDNLECRLLLEKTQQSATPRIAASRAAGPGRSVVRGPRSACHRTSTTHRRGPSRQDRPSATGASFFKCSGDPGVLPSSPPPPSPY